MAESGDRIWLAWTLKNVKTDEIMAQWSGKDADEFMLDDPTTWWYKMIGMREGAIVRFRCDKNAKITENGPYRYGVVVMKVIKGDDDDESSSEEDSSEEDSDDDSELEEQKAAEAERAITTSVYKAPSGGNSTEQMKYLILERIDKHLVESRPSNPATMASLLQKLTQLAMNQAKNSKH